MRKRDEHLNQGWVQIVHALKMETNSRGQKINSADAEGVLRIIQSRSSSKVNLFKRWLVKISSKRIEEINNPELTMVRMKQIYEKKGYSKLWIEQR